MEWYNYIADFFAGAFLANAIPHYVKGICGDKFPTPFAKPPGRGLSSPVLNVVWGLLNVVIGYFLLKAGHVHKSNMESLGITFGGAIVMSIMLASNFAKKDKE